MVCPEGRLACQRQARLPTKNSPSFVKFFQKYEIISMPMLTK
jgi:hypothetical protein